MQVSDTSVLAAGSRAGQSGQGDDPPCRCLRFAPRFLSSLTRLLQGLACGGICRVPQLHGARGEGGAGAACAETAVLGDAEWLISGPNYISLMSTHTVIEGSSGAKRRSRLF